jgi:phage-related protein
MKNRGSFFHTCLALLMFSGLLAGSSLVSAQSQAMPQDQDDNITRQQLAGLDSFLDSHPPLAEALRKDPSLVNNQEFVERHSDFKQYLQQHPEVREELNQHPNAIMRQEQRYDRREDRDGDRDRAQDRDRDVTRRELANMDQFMDKHPEIAEQLRKDPSLVDNKQFVANHPDLQEFLRQHPRVAEEYKENPNGFMSQEQRYDRREDRAQGRDRDVTRREPANMDQFMDKHPEISEQLRKDPSLVDSKKFVDGHPALEQFLAEHPGVREEYRENPNGFMAQEQRFDRREDRVGGDNDVTRRELANMDRFMDKHPEIAEQLRNDPSLVDSKKFVSNHPELQQFLAEHPGVSEEYKENPNAFMRQEQRFDRHEDSRMGGDRDRELSSFNEFMEGHSNIAQELSKNPSLANNQEYLANHPALKEYLANHPQVHQQLAENPPQFLQSARQAGTPGTPATTTKSKLPGDSKPKQ